MTYGFQSVVVAFLHIAFWHMSVLFIVISTGGELSAGGILVLSFLLSIIGFSILFLNVCPSTPARKNEGHAALNVLGNLRDGPDIVLLLIGYNETLTVNSWGSKYGGRTSCQAKR